MWLYVHRSIERAAQHEAKRTEQEAKGELERQKLQNEKVRVGTRRPTVDSHSRRECSVVCQTRERDILISWQGSRPLCRGVA